MLDPSVEENIEELIQTVYAQSQSAGTRVKCSVLSNSWAFAAPLHNPPAGTTGWCVDSAGAAKPINTDFETASGAFTGGLCP